MANDGTVGRNFFPLSLSLSLLNTDLTGCLTALWPDYIWENPRKRFSIIPAERTRQCRPAPERLAPERLAPERPGPRRAESHRGAGARLSLRKCSNRTDERTSPATMRLPPPHIFILSFDLVSLFLSLSLSLLSLRVNPLRVKLVLVRISSSFDIFFLSLPIREILQWWLLEELAREEEEEETWLPHIPRHR